MNKKVTIIPSSVSLQKAIGTNKETYNCLGIFPTTTDLRKFEFLKSTVSMYKAFEMVGSIYCEDYNNCPKLNLHSLLKNQRLILWYVIQKMILSSKISIFLFIA